MKQHIFLAIVVAMTCLFGTGDTVLGGTLKIYPPAITVKTGHTVRFTAVADENYQKNFTPVDCQWTATGGNIDSVGNFRAFDKPGSYEAQVYANGKQAVAKVTVVPDKNYAPVKPGAIFIRQWHFYQSKDPSKINVRVSALTKGETVKKARLYLVHSDGSEELLSDINAHHNGRAKFHAMIVPAQGQWLAFKTYDHLDRILAHTMRMI